MNAATQKTKHGNIKEQGIKIWNPDEMCKDKVQIKPHLIKPNQFCTFILLFLNSETLILHRKIKMSLFGEKKGVCWTTVDMLWDLL